MMGGAMAHEFMYLTPVGEDTLLLCDNCGYAANRQIARFRKPKAEEEAPLDLEEVATPEIKTIDGLAKFLEIPKARTAKAVFMVATLSEAGEDVERFVFAVVRGDMDLNETKLLNALKAKDLRPAKEEEIVAQGAVPGFASPIGIQGALVVVDDLVPESPNLVAGANKDGFHLRNVNYGRDFEADIVADIVAADEGHGCPECGSELRTVRGVEAGNIFKLGTRYSAAMDATFLDQEGEEHPVVMGSYGIGSGRLLACSAEAHHDEQGLIWPISVAPFQVHLLSLRGGEAEAEGILEDLTSAGVEVLFDDRDESPGVKFADADLLGMPIRVTVSKRSLEGGGAEVKLRRDTESHIVSLEALTSDVISQIESLEAEIQAKVVEVPFEA
jgi:prolyl-tRNA synthetase